jgi:inorganic pyrophosphatase
MNTNGKGENGKNGKGSTSVTVTIETPRASRNKFKYDTGLRQFRLSKILPDGMSFPYDFGFIPETLGDDGDPIDVLVLIEEPTFPGCVLECRLVGVLEARQREASGKTGRNDRLIAVAAQSINFSNVRRLGDLGATILKNIEAFFVNYQALRNVQVSIVGRHGPQRAARLLEKASAAWLERDPCA